MKQYVNYSSLLAWKFKTLKMKKRWPRFRQFCKTLTQTNSLKTKTKFWNRSSSVTLHLTGRQHAVTILTTRMRLIRKISVKNHWWRKLPCNSFDLIKSNIKSTIPFLRSKAVAVIRHVTLTSQFQMRMRASHHALSTCLQRDQTTKDGKRNMKLMTLQKII